MIILCRFYSVVIFVYLRNSFIEILEKDESKWKGFTLVEVLAVLVILSAIVFVALPVLSSSMERSKESEEENKKERIVSLAEIYFSDNKEKIYKNIEQDECFVSVSYLYNYSYLFDDVGIYDGYVVFNKIDNSNIRKGSLVS